MKNEITRRFEERGKKITIVTKDVGYELRCAPPIPFDIEYTRDLGYGAVAYLTGAEYSDEMKRKGAMISILGGKLNPIPFDEIMDPVTGRTRVRTVDVTSYAYQVARSYMIRLEKEDFENSELLAAMAQVANMDVESFKKRFGHLAS